MNEDIRIIKYLRNYTTAKIYWSALMPVLIYGAERRLDTA